MASALSDTSYWLNFFKECGVPAGEATSYAITFTDHRISKEMLNDLTKEYLFDMGINVLGDVIAVLKHAKEVFKQNEQEKKMKGTSNISVTPRRSTAASRIVGHYIGKDPDAAPMNLPLVPKISKELSARLGGQASTSPVPSASGSSSLTVMIKTNPNKLEEVVPVPKTRRVFPEHEGKYKITMPAGTTEKTKKILRNKVIATKGSSVFDRLGADNPDKSTILMGEMIVKSNQSSVFSRLGGKTAVKRAASSTIGEESSDEECGEVLEYAGVLKNVSPVKRKKVTTTTIKKVTKISPNVPSIQSEGIFGGLEGSTPSRNLQERLGKKISEGDVSSTTPDIVTSNKGLGIQKRLGAKVAAKSQKQSITTTAKAKGVFGRLGKKAS